MDFADAFAFTGGAAFAAAFAGVFAAAAFAGAFDLAGAAGFIGAFAAAFAGAFTFAVAAFAGAFAAAAIAGAFDLAGVAGFAGFLSDAEAPLTADVLGLLSTFDALLATAFDVFSLLAISQILLQQIWLNQSLYQRMIRLTSQ